MGMSKVGYLLVISHIWCSEVYDRLDIYNSC